MPETVSPVPISFSRSQSARVLPSRKRQRWIPLLFFPAALRYSNSNHHHHRHLLHFITRSFSVPAHDHHRRVPPILRYPCNLDILHHGQLDAPIFHILPDPSTLHLDPQTGQKPQHPQHEYTGAYVLPPGRIPGGPVWIHSRYLDHWRLFCRVQPVAQLPRVGMSGGGSARAEHLFGLFRKEPERQDFAGRKKWTSK